MTNMTDPASTPDNPFHLTLPERLTLSENDADNARRLLSEFGPDLLFVAGRNWAVWDGNRYSFQAGDLAAYEVGARLRDLVTAEADFAATTWEPPHEILARMCLDNPRICPDVGTAKLRHRRDTADRLRKHGVKCGNVAKIKSALEHLAHLRRTMVEDLDGDPFQFICPNGEINLLTARKWERPEGMTEGEETAARAAWLRPIRRETMPTRCAGVDYDPAAICPEWEKFVALVVPDPHVRACLKRILGAMLFGENKAQICVILRGPGGNGKSTLLEALQNVLGTRDGYAATCKIDMFLETGQTNSASANPEEVDLPGARAYIATEPGARDVLSAKKIKSLTGGDRRMSRGLFKDAFFWTPQGVPLLSCNRLPKVKDEDEGTRRRLLIVPLEVNLRALPLDQQVAPGKIAARLRAEGSGILNWLIDGFRDFWTQGIAPPQKMVDLKSALLEGADPVGVFLDDMVAKSDRPGLNVTDFYKVYEAWCETEGRALFQMKTVGDIMVEKGVERGKSNGRSVWRGLAWDASKPGVADLVEKVTGARPAEAAPPEVPDF